MTSTKYLFTFVVLMMAVLLLSSCGSCDGVALNFFKVFEQKTPNDLNASFVNLIYENTEILSDCVVVGYTQSDISASDEWLQEYNLERYNVNYSCDILDFNIDFYKTGNSFYLLRAKMVPCGGGKKNVDFHESAENLVKMWYSTNYLLEYIVISNSIDNLSFCAKLETKIFGEAGNYCR